MHPIVTAVRFTVRLQNIVEDKKRSFLGEMAPSREIAWIACIYLDGNVPIKEVFQAQVCYRMVEVSHYTVPLALVFLNVDEGN